MSRLEIDDLVPHLGTIPLVDVRTPAEFEKGKIPFANNIPLFSNEERAAVGTTYKQVGRHPAILQGLEFVGPKMRALVEAAEALAGPPEVSNHLPFDLIVHCWRGGMRSGSVGWLYGNYGWRVATVEGGYKAYRNWALDMFGKPWKLVTVGGRTGSGKTEVLHALRDLGEQVIDLEGLANHRGSAFGALGLPDQPSQQTFENELALQFQRLDPERRIFIEDESRMVGTCCVPQDLMDRKRDSPLLVLEASAGGRLDHLVNIYGDAAVDGLRDSFVAIERRLGPERVSKALEALDAGDVRAAAAQALDYYDRAYDYGINKRNPEQIQTLDIDGLDHHEIAERLAQMDVT